VQYWDAPDDARPLEQEDVWPSDAELLLTASFSKAVQKRGEVSVRVDDAADRIAGTGGVMFSYDGGGYFSEEEDGVFRAELPPGRYQARVLEGDTLVGYSDWFELGAGEERDLGTIRTRHPASLVIALDCPPALADKFMWARVARDEQERVEERKFPADANELTIEGLLEGSAVVEVWGNDVARERQAVELLGNTPTSVRFSLQPAGHATIHVESAVTEGFGRLIITVRRETGELYHEVAFRERWGAELPFDFGVSTPTGRYPVEVTTTSGLTARGELVMTSLTEPTSLTLVLE